MNRDKAVKQLQRALGTLPGTEARPRARRNARKRVLSALRKIRGVVDTEYPAIVKRAGYTRLTPEGRLNRLKRAGLVPIDDSADAATFSICGIRVVEAHHRGALRWFVPRWAKLIGTDNPVKLKAARRSRKIQVATLAAEALRTPLAR